MSDFSSIVAQAAAEAQATMGETFVGPDGKTYVGVFRSANAFETAAAGQEMQPHGFEDKTLLVVAATRTQWGAPPYGWRRKKLFRQSPAGQECTILSLNVDDPNFFIFPVIFRQPASG